MEWTEQLKVLSFRNCDLHCCHLDGFKNQREAFLIRLAEIEHYFLGKPSHSMFRIWYNLDETLLDSVLLEQIASSVIRFKSHIVKIAFIGLNHSQQWKLSKNLKADKDTLVFPYVYFSDAEKAKEWLI
jgi:hypothetical protein